MCGTLLFPFKRGGTPLASGTTVGTLGGRNEGSGPPRSWQDGSRKWCGMVLNRITAVSGFGFLFSGEG